MFTTLTPSLPHTPDGVWGEEGQVTGTSHRGERRVTFLRGQRPGDQAAISASAASCSAVAFSLGHFLNKEEGLGRCCTSQQPQLSEASLPAGRRGAGPIRKVINHENYDDADVKLFSPPPPPPTPDNDYKLPGRYSPLDDV